MATNETRELQEFATTEESTDNNERPDDCQCWNADLDLCCWPCYRTGFESQNPAEPAAEEDES